MNSYFLLEIDHFIEWRIKYESWFHDSNNQPKLSETISCVLVHLHCQSILAIFLVNLCNSFFGFGHVAHPIRKDVEFNGRLQKLYALCGQIGSTCGVDLFLHIGGLLIEVCSLASFTHFIAFHALDVGFGGVVPPFGQFVVGGCLFE